MAMFTVLATLSACLLLSHHAFAKNEAPCQPSKWNNGFDKFVRRHIRSGFPTSLDKNEWEKYIRGNGGCDRPTQSFLHPKDLERVKAVCSNNGGKVFKDNLCISQQTFSFVTVRSEPGTCGIRNVREEDKHLILACEILNNQCLPVHFEGNPNNMRPNNNAYGCQDPRAKGQAASFKMTSIWILTALLLVYSLI